MSKIIKIKTRKGKNEEIEVRDLRDKFYQVDDAYLNGWARKCGIYATGVYNVLCRHVSNDQSCFPSVKLMSDKLAISQVQVKRAVKILEAHNIIKVERFSGHKNIYYLTNKTEWREAVIKWYGAGGSRIATKKERKGMVKRIIQPDDSMTEVWNDVKN